MGQALRRQVILRPVRCHPVTSSIIVLQTRRLGRDLGADGSVRKVRRDQGEDDVVRGGSFAQAWILCAWEDCLPCEADHPRLRGLAEAGV